MSVKSRNLMSLLMQVIHLNGRQSDILGRHGRSFHRHMRGCMYSSLGGVDGYGGMFGGFGGYNYVNGYSLSKARVLTVLYQAETMTQREIAEALDIRPSSMSELISKLLKDGMILREQDEADKRSYKVSLTEKGRRKAEEIESCFSDYTYDVFSCLTMEEQKTLSDLLLKIIDCNREG